MMNGHKFRGLSWYLNSLSFDSYKMLTLLYPLAFSGLCSCDPISRKRKDPNKLRFLQNGMIILLVYFIPYMFFKKNLFNFFFFEEVINLLIVFLDVLGDSFWIPFVWWFDIENQTPVLSPWFCKYLQGVEYEGRV